ncbi:MAG: D-aminoacylase [Armatimonadetes bacterium]|nr:D-aminoacylase [Armatimonadota bacterium]
MTFDVLITGGRIYDGSGAAPFLADVGIVGDRIEEVGSLRGAVAATTIDARGLSVAPGFIDPHNHAHNEAEGGILNIPEADNMLRQGVTTLIAGNCGGSPWPIGEHLEQVGKLPIKQNYAILVGHGTVRGMAVTQGGRPPSEKELKVMKDLVRRAMDEGALGISTGYFPSWVTTEEIVELARIVAECGGVYASHIRSEGEEVLDAVAEAIEIGRRAGLPVQISHIKTWGKKAWDKKDQILELLDTAAREIDVSADRYPYTASFTGVAALIPSSIREEASRRGGFTSLLDNDWRESVLAEIADFIDTAGGADKVVFAPLAPDPELDGRTLEDVAADRGVTPAELVVELSIRGGVSCIFHAMQEDNLRDFLRHKLVMIGSDGHLRSYGKGFCHPRNYGTFPRAIGRYGRDQGLYDMATAIKKATSMPAEKFGLKGRGYIKRGCMADIVVFDEQRLLDTATFEQPHRYPAGVVYVLVNGKLAVDNERTLPGGHGAVITN